MRGRRLSRLIGAATLLVARVAPALDVETGGTPIHIDITESTSVIYNADNRNDRTPSVETLADDDAGFWYNRLNAQASSGVWNAGLRLDSALFFVSPSPTEIGLELLERRRGSLDPPFSDADASFFVQKTLEAGDELSNRYIDWIYPAKYYVGYTTPEIEANGGDFYAQLGRGLVLSVRKQDELSSDTTVRGLRVTGRLREPLRIKLTALGGVMNPLRLDEASGRYLSVDANVTRDVRAVTEAGMPRAIETDFGEARPSYAPDRIAAAQIEAGGKIAQIGIQGSLLDRQTALSGDIVRSADLIRTGSLSLNLPDVAAHGNAYLEAALQSLRHESAPDTDLDGYAVYGALTFIERPLTLTAEAKHYRRFYPLSANVDLGQAPEFSAVQYSAPPTTEAVFVDTEYEGFNTCVTGGRLKGDVEVGPTESLFAWVGRYDTWAESVTNERCETRDVNMNRVWDTATGFEILSQARKSRAQASVGARLDETLRPIPTASGGTSQIFYMESYVRYDVTRWLAGDWSLQLQGWHRRRRQTLGGPVDGFYQGQHLTGVRWAELLVAAGFEYDTDPKTPTTYLNGQVQYELSSSSNLSLFVGQRRGGLRCVSGVCRVFPPFEGARFDVTWRL
jgi:hypothetical protein